MSLLISVILGSIVASACGNPVKTSLVGWGPNDEALIRVEHHADGGEIHDLSLTLRGPNSSRRWEILNPEDEQRQRVRGQRWRVAEAELVEMGVTILPDLIPLPEPESGKYDIPGSQWRVSNEMYKPDSYTYVQRLKFEAVGKRPLFQSYYSDDGHMGGFFLESFWVSPNGKSIVIIGNRASEVLAVPPPPGASADPTNPITRTVVGWGENGTPLVREATHSPTGDLLQLNLILHGSYGVGVVKRWTILAPEDKADPAVRGQRWTAAEKEIVELGIAITPDATPLTQCAEDPCAPVTIQGSAWTVQQDVEDSVLKFTAKGDRPEYGNYDRLDSSIVAALWLAPDRRHIAIPTDTGTHVAWVPRDPKPEK